MAPSATFSAQPDAAALLAQATCETGLHDFGDGQFRGLYEHFGLPLDGVEAAVRGWLDDPGHRSDRFGRWTYDLADYGVSADEVGERFVGYPERFGV